MDRNDKIEMEDVVHKNVRDDGVKELTRTLVKMHGGVDLKRSHYV